MKTRIKKSIKRLVLLVVCLMAILAGSLLLDRYEHYVFLVGEYFGIGTEKITMKENNEMTLQAYALDELYLDQRIEWNQSMMLINTEHRLKDVYVPAVSQYKDTGVYMNDCIQESYQQLSRAVTEETGSKLYVSSDYRTKEKQQELYEEDPKTATEVGASEHQTGLAMDVYVSGFAGDGFIQSEAGRFVNSHSWEYGFIIRYPVFGEKETGIRFEPWHIRYVGVPHAEIIYHNRLTLEEYIDSLEEGKWYELDNYQISRQQLSDLGELNLPPSYKQATISPDNTGGYIITIKVE